MTEEEHKLLKENNDMLKYICSYINYRCKNISSEQIEAFLINLAADRMSARLN